MATLSAFLLSREVSKPMIKRGQGTIIFTGATASVRGGAGFSAFSSAMVSRFLLVCVNVQHLHELLESPNLCNKPW